MEWTILNNINLGNQLVVNFSMEWSKDGRLFVLNDSFVTVLKLTPNMSSVENTLSFTRSEIHLGNFHIANNTNIKYDDILLNLSKERLYHQVLNANVSPESQYTNSLKSFPVFAAWSPTLDNVPYKNNSLLGVISNTGNLEIFEQSRIKWKSIANITEYWFKHQQNDWKDEEKLSNNSKYDLHVKRINESLITCFSWSKVYNLENFYFLYIIAGHKSGSITIWKLNYFNSNENTKPVFVHSFHSNFENLTSIHFRTFDHTKGWIFVGNLDGYVKKFNFNFVELKNDEVLDIWTHKDVRVNKMISLQFDQFIGLIIIKGPFLVFAILNKENNLVSADHYNCGNINITGIENISPGNYVITTLTGSLQKFKIVKTPKKYELKFADIKNELKWEFHSCHAVAKSPNEIVWGILTQPCKMIDHLVVRNPIQIIFNIDSNFDPGSHLKMNPSLQLQQSWEGLEVLRCLCAKNNTLPCTWLTKIEKYDELSLYESRLFMWLSIVCDTLIEKRSKCKKFKSTLPNHSTLKQIVIFKYQLEKITELLEKFENNKKIITDFHHDSLFLLFDAIKYFQDGEIFKLYFEEKTSLEINEIERRYKNIELKNVSKCLWCNDDLTSKPCTTNHPDQRCPISGVQIPGIAKWECNNCGIPAHDLNEDEEIFCPLCDIPMVQMT